MSLLASSMVAPFGAAERSRAHALGPGRRWSFHQVDRLLRQGADGPATFFAKGQSSGQDDTDEFVFQLPREAEPRRFQPFVVHTERGPVKGRSVGTLARL